MCIGNRVAAETVELVSVVGPLYTPLDILANKMPLPGLISAIVVVFQSGAYGYSASPLGFLGHPHPGQILL